MMNDQDIARLAADCQRLGRALAPFQNWGEIELPPSRIVRLWRRINPFHRSNPRSLTTQQVTELTSALISAGNFLALLPKKE